MSKEIESVRLDIARTPFEAQVVLVVLEDAGIPVHLNGMLCQDEFAISQMTMGARVVEITVPADREEEALAAIEEAREQGQAFETEAVQAKPQIGDLANNRRSPLIAALLGLGFGPLGLLYVASFPAVLMMWITEVILVVFLNAIGIFDLDPHYELRFGFLALHSGVNAYLAIWHNRHRLTEDR